MLKGCNMTKVSENNEAITGEYVLVGISMKIFTVCTPMI